MTVPADASGEIGTLSRAFARMAAEVQEKSAALTQETAERRRLFETSLDLILVADPQGRVHPGQSELARDPRLPARGDDRPIRHRLRSPRRCSTSPGPRCAGPGASGVTRVFECRYVHKDGHPVTLQWIGVWSEPERRHFYIGRDMTERKKAEEALLGKRARWRAASSTRRSMPSCRWTRPAPSSDGIRQAEAMFGWSRAEAIGRPLATTIVPPAHRARHVGGARALPRHRRGARSWASASRSKRCGRDGGEYQGRDRRHGAAPPARLRVQRLHPRPDRQDRRRGAAAPVAEDGRGRPAHRRRRARLQQHPHRHHRHDRDPAPRASPTGRSSPRSPG